MSFADFAQEGRTFFTTSMVSLPPSFPAFFGVILAHFLIAREREEEKEDRERNDVRWREGEGQFLPQCFTHFLVVEERSVICRLCSRRQKIFSTFTVSLPPSFPPFSCVFLAHFPIAREWEDDKERNDLRWGGREEQFSPQCFTRFLVAAEKRVIWRLGSRRQKIFSTFTEE